VTLGELFRKKRLEGGWSLEQLSALTKIHIKILRAIESDSYANLPARAFTRGFIVNYAKALKLNPDEVLANYHDFLEQRFNERLDRDKGHQGYVFEGKEIEQTRRWMVIGASIAIVFTAATLFIFKPQNHKHREQHKDFEGVEPTITPVESPTPLATLMTGTASSLATPTSTLMNTPAALSSANSPSPSPSAAKTIATPLPSAMPSATLAPPESSPSPIPSPSVAEAKADTLNKGDDLAPKDIKFKIIFQAKDDVWVRYRSDDKPSNLLILRKGRFLAIKAAKQLLFETPHAESLRYKIKGSYQDLHRSKGQIGADSSLSEYTGNELGSSSFPETIPASPIH